MERGELSHPNNPIKSEFFLQMQLFFLLLHLSIELHKMKKNTGLSLDVACVF
jgi:hypothetical protein